MKGKQPQHVVRRKPLRLRLQPGSRLTGYSELGSWASYSISVCKDHELTLLLGLQQKSGMSKGPRNILSHSAFLWQNARQICSSHRSGLRRIVCPQNVSTTQP